MESFEIFWNHLKSLESFGRPMTLVYGILWNLLESFGIFWNLSDSFGIFLDILKSFWNLLESFWNLLESFGIFEQLGRPRTWEFFRIP